MKVTKIEIRTHENSKMINILWCILSPFYILPQTAWQYNDIYKHNPAWVVILTNVMLAYKIF